MPEGWLVDCPTHSGNAMLVAWSCEGQNGNLLISPELTGEAQTISFWGRGFTISAGMNETFSVWVSFTDTAIKSFTQVHDVENYPESGVVPEEWTEYKATLPEGAKYFAILHDAYDSYALFLDDFTFEAGGVLPHDTKIEGYNVYCNNALLCDADAAAAAHNPASDGTYNYRVSAVYNHGESRATVPVEIEFDGFANVGVESAQIAPDTTISCEQRTVTVNAPEGTPISIVDLGGRIIASGTGTLSATIAGDNVVIVAAGAQIAKVTLK